MRPCLSARIGACTPQNVVGARRASWRVLNQAEALVKDKMESEVLQRY